MGDLVHRYAPAQPGARFAMGVTSGAVGVFLTLFALWTFIGGMPAAIYLGLSAGFVLLLVGIAALWVSATLGRGLVQQAEAAPQVSNPTQSGPNDAGSATADPVSTLQQRYADGDIDDAEFERRMDRLLESDAVSQNEERQTESALER